MSVTRTGALNELEAALLYTPLGLRRSHLQRLADLIPEILPGRAYAYADIFQKITGFRPETAGDSKLSGGDLHRELGRLLRALTPVAALNAGDEAEETLPVLAAAGQCRVGLGTLRRWSRQGLPVAWHAWPGGESGWGVRRAALEKFLAARRARAAKEVKRLTEEERRAVLARAHDLTREGLSPAQTILCLAKEFSYSPSSVRRLLRREGGQIEETKQDTCGLTAADFEELIRRYRAGSSVRDLAKAYRRSSVSIYRALHTALMQRVLNVKIEYLPNPAFAEPGAEALCLGAEGFFCYPPEAQNSPSSAPPETPPYLAELYAIPLLSRERETELFRKYNYLKYCAAMLQEQIRHTGYRAGMIEKFEKLQDAAEQARRILIRCNLRLVVSIAKRHMGPMTTLPDLVSEGNMCLIRTVECYDFAREARFATYATWAISKHFARIVPEENYHMAAFVTGQQAKIESTGDRRVAAYERTETIEHLRAVLARAAGALTDREREVIASHYGTDGRSAKTLEEIGALFGLTRERIRQIEACALGKLRSVLQPRLIEGML